MNEKQSGDLDRSLAVVTEHTSKVAVEISRAGAQHLVAWDTDQRVRALHEAGHTVVGSVLGIPIKTADIRGHRGGYTESGADDDDQPQAQTGSQMLDRIVMHLAGQSAEKLLIGQGTNGARDDLERATSIALDLIHCGLDPRAPFINVGALPTNRPPNAIFDAMGDALLATLKECRERADALAAEHRDSIIHFAQVLHDARRLTDHALIDTLREAGLRTSGLLTTFQESGRPVLL